MKILIIDDEMELLANLPKSKKIIVTASGTKDNLAKAFVKGCDGFLVKPVKRDILEEKMHALGLVQKAQPAGDQPNDSQLIENTK